MITAPAARSRATAAASRARRAAGPERRAELGRHVAGVENVLDADRHAVQRTRARVPCRRCSSAACACRMRVLAVEERPGLNLALDLVDARRGNRATSSAERDAALADVAAAAR